MPIERHLFVIHSIRSLLTPAHVWKGAPKSVGDTRRAELTKIPAPLFGRAAQLAVLCAPDRVLTTCPAHHRVPLITVFRLGRSPFTLSLVAQPVKEGVPA